MDVVAQRHLLAKVRRIARGVPLFWPLYGVYWRARSWYEAEKDYSAAASLYEFGVYPEPNLENPVSQLCTSNQLLSPVYRKWCRAMHSPARFSRKQWEFVFILQVLKMAGILGKGKKGLGFGCGREPLAGLFAKYGCEILATDLARELAHERGWVDTMQHASSLEGLYSCASEFITEQDFSERVTFRSVNMNDIPPDLEGRFDFVWSACALEHLGSLQHGLDFIKNSTRCLKKGGVAVHTTEFNLSSNDATCEDPSCSIYRARDMERLTTELEAAGYQVEPLNFNAGGGKVDKHIDIPPYGFSPHLKLMLSGYVVTSIGLIIRRPA